MIPALVPNQAEECPICGHFFTYMPEFNDHHLLARSLGGTVTIRICIECHNKTEGFQPVSTIYVPRPDGETHGMGTFFVIDHEGKTIVERPAFQVMTSSGPLEPPPAGWDAPTFIATLQNTPTHLSELSGRFRLLRNDELVSAGEALGRLSHVAWRLRAMLFHLALQRTPWGNREKLLLDIARQFGLELREARTEAKIIGWLEDHPAISAKIAELDEELPPREAMKVIMAAADPESAVELWQTEYAGQRGTATFKSVVETGQEPDWCGVHDCPHCGAPLQQHRRKP